MLVATMLCSCISLPPLAPALGSAQQAQQWARQGDHVRAASEYEALAAQSAPPARIDLQLAAAREWLAANRAADTARVLASIPATASPAQRYEQRLLDAEATLLDHRPELAWLKISALAANPSGVERYETLRMQIALAASRPVDGIGAEMAAERSASAADRTQLRRQLLAGLRLERARGVKLDARSSQDPIVRGWLDLAASAPPSGSVSLSSQTQAAHWSAQYPNHPANEVLAEAFPMSLTPVVPGTRIALLLPLSGAASSQAAVVRDGFLSAYYQLPQNARPALNLYDTGAISATEAIARAHSAGSAFIVGPLTREDVAAVANLGNESVPVLALNFLPADRPGPAGFFQYAISPENEARLVARRVLADGHHRGIALVPRGDWGNRVIDAFNRELTAGGGALINQLTYDPNEHDYSDALSSVLRVDESEARHQRLQRVLGAKLDFEPRHRADVEFMFVVAETAASARLLAPQLRYVYAGDIPSYTISTAYEPDSIDSNRDIDGLVYPDMPWMVSGDTGVADVRTVVGQAWGDRVAWQSRLFAFGYDACQLALAMYAPHVNYAELQIAGLTGQLRFDADRRVERGLIWVQVSRDGEPKPVIAPAQAGAPVPATAAGAAAE